MKKTAYLIMMVVVMFLAARFAFAEEMKGSMKEGEMEGKGMMMGKGMMDKGMMGKGMMGDDMMDAGMMKMMMNMHGMMMRSPTMVVSNDGGVIVLTGSKLYKYDKNLNLVKEAEIKADMDCGMMGGMGGKKKMCCPGKKMMGQDDAAAEGEAVQPAAEDAEHKSHH